MKKVELLLPAGNEECLRAAVNNRADAVYLGLNKFNARQFAGNFNENNIFSIIDYCHNRNVKVYITFNTLVKNSELKEYFRLINIAYSAKADAIIIQDPCFIPLIKKNFPGLRIHLSTQATTTNNYSIPEGIDRVILARELSLDEITSISKNFETEIFVHGALCLSYSGQCLFSSIAGGRSGNRGMCAQPCRKIYNKKYLLSTMDLCLLPKIPELIKTGASCFKVEGRMRTPLYVATVARIYRKAIDSYYKGNFSFSEKDISDLKLVFNREFTTGFAFNSSIVDSQKPMNRGLYIGTFEDGKLKLKEDLKIGDGIGIWINDKVIGYTIREIIKENHKNPRIFGMPKTAYLRAEARSFAVFQHKKVKEAFKGDIIKIDSKGAKDGTPVYKTSSADMRLNLGDKIKYIKPNIKKTAITLPHFNFFENKDKNKIFVKVYDKSSALKADAEKADIIYYNILKEDCLEVKRSIKNSKFFVYIPRILSDKEIDSLVNKIKTINPDGVLVGNKGLLKFLKDYELHLDYSFNCFNDIDLNCYNGLPIISPELNFKEVISLKNKRFIVLVHGDIILMNTKQPLNVPELVDEENRRFRVRKNNGIYEILNSKQLGLFNKAREYVKNNIKYFYIDAEKDVDKFIRIYRRILNLEPFNDNRIRKGYTTGHFNRGVF